VFGTSVGNEG